jgi:hypothetical protein
MKPTTNARILAITLGAYVVCDILLTPPAHLETRDPAKVTGLGIATLALLFLGLALAVVAIVLLFRRSPRADRRDRRCRTVSARLPRRANWKLLSASSSGRDRDGRMGADVVVLIVIGVGYFMLRREAAPTTSR